MVLGGVPIRVAAPPMLEASTSGTTMAAGWMLRAKAIWMLMGVIRSMTVVSFSTDERTPVMETRMAATRKALPRARRKV